MSAAQQPYCPTQASGSNVTTWHDDYNRTGWQCNETTLDASHWQNNPFGLLWQWNSTNSQLQGAVYAQPLAANNVPVSQSCQQQNNCPNLVFIATEQDWLYAFNATQPGQYYWSQNLAAAVGGSYVNCQTNPDLSNWAPCGSNGVFVGIPSGVTGTPVIDVPNNVLFVAEVVSTGAGSGIAYYLLAVDIRSGTILAKTPAIQGSVVGYRNTKRCTSQYPNQGTVTFDPTVHIQRSGLLFLPGSGNGVVDVVYVAFAPFPEVNNGWIFAYPFQNNGGQYSFGTPTIFVSTPYGTGGGFWGSGAAPAFDGTYIYAATGNGTLFDANDASTIPADIGDALLKLLPIANSPGLSVVDWYAPSDVLNYPGNEGPGLCINDLDFGSGGVLLPPGFTYKGLSVVINADKQSNLYVANRANLGGFNQNGGNNIETVQTPLYKGKLLNSTQGYWASPAYWFDGTNSWLYYVPTTDVSQVPPPDVLPYALNAYQLTTSGAPGSYNPIPQTPTASTSSLFCMKSPTPTVSSNPNSVQASGIVWAIERQNVNNPKFGNCDGNWTGHVALHAYSAYPPSGTWSDLYNSGNTSANQYIGEFTAFPVPTVFNGYVYMGTQEEVDVFGLCSNGPGGKCMGQ